jgi:hypothetical protein
MGKDNEVKLDGSAREDSVAEIGVGGGFQGQSNTGYCLKLVCGVQAAGKTCGMFRDYGLCGELTLCAGRPANTLLVSASRCRKVDMYGGTRASI